MKPIFHIAAAAALLALGACSTAVDNEPLAGLDGVVTNAGPLAAPGVPQFAAASTALPALLAQGNARKITYAARGDAPIISGGIIGNCPFAQAQRAGVYTAAAAPLRAIEARREYRFTQY